MCVCVYVCMSIDMTIQNDNIFYPVTSVQVQRDIMEGGREGGREVEPHLFPSSREEDYTVTRGVASADARGFSSAEVSQARLAPSPGPFVEGPDAPHLWSAATVCVCVCVCYCIYV